MRHPYKRWTDPTRRGTRSTTSMPSSLLCLFSDDEGVSNLSLFLFTLSLSSFLKSSAIHDGYNISSQTPVPPRPPPSRLPEGHYTGNCILSLLFFFCRYVSGPLSRRFPLSSVQVHTHESPDTPPVQNPTRVPTTPVSNPYFLPSSHLSQFPVRPLPVTP